jgi:uncharacterized membrane protein required for colicin V production
LLVIFIAVAASIYTEGMWGNAVRLINVVTASLVAVNFFEPLAEKLDGWQPSYTYIWDFVVLWGLFVVAMIVLRIITDSVCRVKVRFLKLAERIGSGVFAALVGLAFVCFTTFTLHTAPLSENFMFGGFQPGKSMLFIMAPDRWCERFARSVSEGGFSRLQPNVFDPHGQFQTNYNARRAKLEAHANATDSIRVR